MHKNKIELTDLLNLEVDSKLLNNIDFDNIDPENENIEYYKLDFLFKTKIQIKQWLTNKNITNFEINDDLTVDVDDDVILYMQNIEEFPFQFNEITGELLLGQNGLTTLKGLPYKLGGMLTIGGENIKSLQYLSQHIQGSIRLFNNLFLEDYNSDLKKCNNIIQSTKRINGIGYIDIDQEYGIYTYDTNSYIQWQRELKNYFKGRKYEL